MRDFYLDVAKAVTLISERQEKLKSYIGTQEAKGRDYIDVEFRFLFPTPKDRLMAEAQESLASSPELSLVKGSNGDLEHRSKIMRAWEWENKKSPHQGLIFSQTASSTV